MLADESADLLAVLTHTGVSRLTVRRALAPLLRCGLGVGESLEALELSDGAPAVRALGRALRHRMTSADVEIVAAVATELTALRQRCISILTLGQPGYPPLLAEIPDPPLALFVCGKLGPLADRAVAIVGSRRCAPTSAMLATDIAQTIAQHGRVVVSGLASGVDGAAHRGAVQAGRSTVAVLGHGHGHCYPARHRGLARRILETDGALISEYPPSWPPRRHFFPERNRIISGLTEAVLVVEASARSGSLITARLALEQGRDVLAVPGSISTGSHSGCHRLLKDGAALVEGIEDVYAALAIDTSVGESIGESIHGTDATTGGTVRSTTDEPIGDDAGLSELETRLLDLTGGDGRSTEVLVEMLGEPASRTLGLLTELELKGFVRAIGDGYIRRPAR
jgi:DNA processing protein